MQKWKPSKSRKISFAVQMDLIREFCEINNIITSKNNDSYYFTVNGIYTDIISGYKLDGKGNRIN